MSPRPDATELARAIRCKTLSPRELVEQAITRAETLNPHLNAIVEDDFAKALARADALLVDEQPFAGVPTLLKDLATPCVGDTAYQGNRLLKQIDHRYASTSAVVARLNRAGFINIGRSHSPEFGCGNCTAAAETALYGPTCNPWDVTRTAMGSSGGAAAAVATGIVPIAQATDGGGSIRMPASACGLVGLKPSRGLISNAPMGEIWAGGCSQGVISRTLRDTATALDSLSGYESGDSYRIHRKEDSMLEHLGRPPARLRIGLCTGLAFAVTARPCREAVESVGRVLEELGHRVEFAHPDVMNSLDYLYDYITIIRVSLAQELESLRDIIARPWMSEDVENGTWINYQRGLKVSAVDYALARERLNAWAREVISWWKSYDLLVLPTLATLPPKIGYLVNGAERERTERLAATIPFTPQFNVTGQPAMSLPLHWSDEGLPVGVQLVAEPGGDELLMSLGGELEISMPWHNRHPKENEAM